MTRSSPHHEDINVMHISFRRRLVTIILASLLTGCVTNNAFRDAKEMINSGQIDAGMAKMAQLLAEDPTNSEYKTYFMRQQELKVNRLISRGQTALINEDFASAEAAFKEALPLDRNDSRATIGLRQVNDARRHHALIQAAERKAEKSPEEALVMVRTVLSENTGHFAAQALKRRIEAEQHREQLLPPRLAQSFKKPITLQFRDASLSEVFEALGKLSGLSFVFDKDVATGSKVTLFANKMSVEDALSVLLTLSQLDKKILGESAVLIYPNNPTKKADYQENIVKSFYIGNADPKQTMNMVKSLARTRDVFIDEKIGLMTVRDSAENIRIIERLIAAQDLIDPEVVLEVEVMEVVSNRLQQLGAQFPSQISFSPRVLTKLVPNEGGDALVYRAGTTSLRELSHLNRGSIVTTLTDPALILNLRAEDGTTNLLANPRIRVKNREKAKVRIGDKVPVVTTTTASTGVSTESVSYLDVGLGLDVAPVIHPDNQISIKMELEVSNVVKEVTSKSGLLTYQIGTRRAETVLRLKDGETQVLAGLIKREERETAAKVPGLGDMPVLGKLFGSTKGNSDKTEIVLLVTPKIVRRTELPPIHVTEFASGSDNYASIHPMRLRPAAKLIMGEGNTAQTTTAPVTPPGQEPRQDQGDPGAVVTFKLEAPDQVKSGEPVNLVIHSTLRQDVSLINLEIDFDPAKLEFSSGNVGPLMGSSGGTPQFQTAREAPGRLRLVAVNPGGARGSGQLATLTFTSKQAGGDPVLIGFGGIFAHDVGGNQVTIMSPDPKPITIAP